MILSGRTIDSDEALRIGLVQAVLSDVPFLAAVLDWVAPIAARPASSLRAAKQAIVGGLGMSLPQGLELEGSLVGPLLATQEAVTIQNAAIERYRSTPPDQIVNI
jgi:enoyl-CoA hydratase